MKVIRESKSPGLFQTLQLISNPTAFLDKCAQRYGDSFTLRVLGVNSPPVVFFSKPQAIRDILAVPENKFDFKKATYVFRPLMGNNSLILQEGSNHQRQRQLLMPSFHGDRMKAYGEIIFQITKEATQWSTVQQFQFSITCQK